MVKMKAWFYIEYYEKAKTMAMSFHTTQNINPLKPLVTFTNMPIAYKSGLKFFAILHKYIKWKVHEKSPSSKLSKAY